MTPKYRGDIDGLRAVAVLSVVFFHAGVKGFSGGYVGVDVFFVISGFLITQIIAREIEQGSFSIWTFYERRVRRIFPALFVMLAAVMLAGALLLLPDDLRALAKSTRYTLLSVSNFLFYREAGYFDEDAIFKPLLHTWSLAVEEQFYLLLPPALLILARLRPRSTKLFIVLTALVSLALAIAVTPENQPFAFYLLPARGWELLAGSVIAFGMLPAVRTGLWREAAALVGICLIVTPVFFYGEDTLFPGLGAIPPVAGTMLVLHCAPDTRLGQLLSMKALRGIGLISYSLYLWHWPIIVFMTYLLQARIGGAHAAAAIALSVAAAALSWRFVEHPFRRARPGKRLSLWTGAFGSAVLLAAMALAVSYSNGMPGRFPADIARFDKARHVSPLRGKCSNREDFTIAPEDACRLGDQNVAPTIAVWADSHGRDLVLALAESGPTKHFSVLQLTAGGCPPTLDASIATQPHCPERNRNVLSYLQKHASITTVILAAYFESARYLRDPGFGPGFLEVVDALRAAGKRVIVVGPFPEQLFDVPRMLALAEVWAEPEPLGVETSLFLEHSNAMRELMVQAEAKKASVVFPHTIFCDAITCSVTKDGQMLYTDRHHPSIEAARMIVAKILPFLQPNDEGKSDAVNSGTRAGDEG